MKTRFFIFVITAGILLSPFTFSQTGTSSPLNPLEAFLNEEEEREKNQTPEEIFQEYVNDILLERQAFQKAFFSMLDFLRNIENKKVRGIDVKRLNRKISEATTLLDENGSALSKKQDRIVESLKQQCMGTTPEVTPTQSEVFSDADEEEGGEGSQTPVGQFQDYVNDIISGREDFQQALFHMEDFLNNIGNNQVRRSDMENLKQELSGASAEFSESTFDLSDKEDEIFESLDQCLQPASGEALSQ